MTPAELARELDARLVRAADATVIVTVFEELRRDRQAGALVDDSTVDRPLVRATQVRIRRGARG